MKLFVEESAQKVLAEFKSDVEKIGTEIHER